MTYYSIILCDIKCEKGKDEGVGRGIERRVVGYVKKNRVRV